MSGLPPPLQIPNIAPSGVPGGPTFAQLLQILSELVNATNANGTVLTSATIVGQKLGGDLSGTPQAALVIHTHLAAPLPPEQGGTGNALGQPSGAAEGDLGGSYPSPTVIATHLTAPLPEAQGGTGNATGSPSGAATGDLSGSYPDPEVIATHLAAPLPQAQGGTGVTSLAGTAALQLYAIGSWTPVLLLGGANVAMTFSTQAGTYIRVGSLVTCFFSLTLTAKGSSTGAATISGLPFPSNADVANAGAGGTCPSYSAMASLTGVPLIQIGPAVSAATLAEAGAAAPTALTDSNVTGTTTISGSFSYRI